MWYVEDHLEHHGILGQKWGVRHKQYPLEAGEHTAREKKAGWKESLGNTVKALKQKAADAHNAKIAAKTEKRVAKLNAYRDKLAAKKAAKAESWNKDAKKEEDDLRDLNEYGFRSNTYRTMIRNKYRNDDNRSFVSEIFPDVTSLNQFRADKSHYAKLYRENAKKYLESNKALSNMSINEFTSKRDIKKAAKSAERKVENERIRRLNQEALKNIYGSSYAKS